MRFVLAIIESTNVKYFYKNKLGGSENEQKGKNYEKKRKYLVWYQKDIIYFCSPKDDSF